MNKTFRKNRQNSLRKGKIRQYLKYAIGEIALLVLGILIAVGINNWNQQKRSEQKITNILKEIQSDILMDLEASNMIFNYHLYTDSISKNILNNTYTLEDVRNGNFRSIGYNYRDFRTTQNGFENLMVNLDKIPKKYKHLLPEIKNLYVDLNTTIEVYNDKMRSVVYENSDEFTNFNWYQDALIGKENNELLDYILNDVKYKSLIARYMAHRNNIYQISTQYRIKAIDLYLKINEAIDGKIDVPEIVNYNNPTSHKYAGLYALKETVNLDNRWPTDLNIAAQNNDLFSVYPEYNLKVKLFPYNDNTFYYNEIVFDASYCGFLIFDKPSKGALYVSDGRSVNSFAIYERIESN